LVPFFAALLLLVKGNSHINNYLIFKNVFWHTVNQQNLYSFYFTEYADKNHYGPFFSLIIAPFAVLPNFIGATLWAMANALILFYAVHKLPLTHWAKNVILLISLIECLTSIQNLQFNPMLCSWIILTYVFIKEGKLGLAAFLIVAGTFVKLYGLVGLPFIFFTKEYKKVISYLILWAILLFCLPMLISSPEFVLKSYVDWYHVLIEKNIENVSAYQNMGMTDISAMGFVKRVSGWYDVSNFYFILPAGICMLLPLVRSSKWNEASFQLSYLAQALIGVVIFSTSAESPTYVIAVVGFAIWYAIRGEQQNKARVYLLFFVLLLTVFSPTDLFPSYLRKEYVVRYSLKALPCFIAWLMITHQLLFSTNGKTIAHAKDTPGHSACT
jgi:hypothetical protein